MTVSLTANPLLQVKGQTADIADCRITIDRIWKQTNRKIQYTVFTTTVLSHKKETSKVQNVKAKLSANTNKTICSLFKKKFYRKHNIIVEF